MTFSTNRKILLGITGSIAAYKSCQLVRMLRKAGYEVVVILTKDATQFVTVKTFQVLSGNPVLTGNEDYILKGGMGHIDLVREADLLVIAPASANTTAKIAQGIADNLITEMALARDIPLLIAPAMNVKMWENSATRRNIQRLQEDGVIILGPDIGEQACGEVGEGRMLEPEVLTDLIKGFFVKPVLQDKKILITTGATQEMIDPVRCITNISSGKMGVELARACRNAGAEVTLVYGEMKVAIPYGMKKAIYTASAREMYEKVHQEIENKDIFISVAAVSDYHVKETSNHKIKKSHDLNHQNVILELEPNPDILASVSALDHEPFCVGFAAESEHLIEYAKQKKIRKNIPLMIANRVDLSLGKDTNTVYLIGNKGIVKIKEQPKEVVAQEIIKVIADYLN